MPSAHIDLVDQEHMSLLGLLLRGFLAKQLGDPRVGARAVRLAGEFVLHAGAMAVTLTFIDGNVAIVEGASARARARLGGEMQALVDVVSGGGLTSAARAVLSGRLRFSGNPLALLALARVLLADVTPSPRAVA